MKIFMKEGDRIYLNGANFQVDRKVSIELLNKSKFLLENHIIRAEDADSPLKQLYFAIQLMIIDSLAPQEAMAVYSEATQSIQKDSCNPHSIQLIRKIDGLVRTNREYQALKLIRGYL